jgi:Na+/proline symporter
MVGKIIFPDLSQVPALHSLGVHASDGAYLAVGIATMPRGMLGLMVTSLFAATISNMDTGLNKNTGIFIRSFYQPLLRPQAPERELLFASRIATFCFGVMTVLAGFMFLAMPGLSLFQLMQAFASLVAMPIAMPLFWGIFIKRTPSWSGWSTVLVCLAASLLVGNLATVFGPNVYQRLLPLPETLAASDVPTIVYSVGVFANLIIGTLWFFGTTFWYKNQPEVFQSSVNEFFNRLQTPLTPAEGNAAASDAPQYRTLGRLCACYGVFISMLTLIPNSAVGRSAFLFVGGSIALVGIVLLRKARKADRLKPTC